MQETRLLLGKRSEQPQNRGEKAEEKQFSNVMPGETEIVPELAKEWRTMLVKEMRRKAIHLSGLSVPIGLIFLGRTVTAAAIALALAVSLLIEMQRLKGKIRLPEVRDHEQIRVAGYIYYITGSLLCVLLLSPMIAVTAMLFLTLGDTVSGLAGPILKDCHVRGMPAPARRWRIKPLPVVAAMFSACLIIGYLATGISSFSGLAGPAGLAGLSFPVYLAGAAAATFADGVAIIIRERSLDDNFTIPVFSGTLMSVVALIG